jgi:hypothetical protein
MNWSSNIKQHHFLPVQASFIVAAHDHHLDDHCCQRPPHGHTEKSEQRDARSRLLAALVIEC